MSIKITDSDGISTIHTPERLQINLLTIGMAEPTVEQMVIEVHFNVKTELSSGKEVGQEYWDSVPLKLTCENNSQLAEAMRVMQQAIGAGRYAQMIAPVPAPVASPGMMQSEQI